MTINFIFYFLIAIMRSQLSESLTWNGLNGTSCDFPGFDLASYPNMSPDQCLNLCLIDRSCTVSQTEVNNRACNIKNRNAIKSAANSVSHWDCFLMDFDSFLFANWSRKCMLNNNGYIFSMTTADSIRCENECQQLTFCSSWYWTYSTSQCYFQNGPVNISDYSLTNDLRDICGFLTKRVNAKSDQFDQVFHSFKKWKLKSTKHLYKEKATRLLKKFKKKMDNMHFKEIQQQLAARDFTPTPSFMTTRQASILPKK